MVNEIFQPLADTAGQAHVSKMMRRLKFLLLLLAVLPLPALAQSLGVDPAVQRQLDQLTIQQQAQKTDLANMQLQQAIQQDRTREQQLMNLAPPPMFPPPPRPAFTPPPPPPVQPPR